jgi:hypothetical protein
MLLRCACFCIAAAVGCRPQCVAAAAAAALQVLKEADVDLIVLARCVQQRQYISSSARGSRSSSDSGSI